MVDLAGWRRYGVSLLFVALSGFAGCSTGSNAPVGIPSDLDYTVDPVTGIVSKVVVPYTGTTAGKDFILAVDGKTSLYWNATLGKRGNDSAVILTPVLNDRGPTLGSLFTVSAVDHATGDSNVIATYHVLKAPDSAVIDPKYATWYQDGIYDLPNGWQQHGDNAGNGLFAKVDSPSGPAVQVSVPNSNAGVWNQLYYWQEISPNALPITVSLRSDHDCDGDRARPQALSGVSVRDFRGYEVTYCLSSRVKTKMFTQVAGGRETVVIVPAKLNKWTPVTIDLKEVNGLVRLLPNKVNLLRLEAGVDFRPLGNQLNRPVTIAFSNFRSH